ncbi:MAG: chromosome segregation protein, partial [Flavobacteriaceae bacterium]|nr:chromosome segregation protein [Flavobacteriaceae bacterium]
MSDEKAPQKENTSPENDAIEKAMVEESEKKSETPRTDSDTDTSENLVEDALVETSEKNAEASKNTSEKNKKEEDDPNTATEKQQDDSSEKNIEGLETKPENSTKSEEENSETIANTSKKDNKEEVSEKQEEEDEEEVASSDEEEKDETEEEDEVDYSELSKKELIAAFAKLLKDKPVQEIKKEAEEIKTEFNSKFTEELEEKKEEFLAEGGNIIDFHYSTPIKKEFNSLYFEFKEKRNNYYKNLKKDLHANLVKREELIEELKSLLTTEENINTTYKHFKDIQERWHTAGPIPRDKYNLTWNTYHHHVENFYDFLHLNREFRDLDFKHNLDQKLKIIIRAEELQQEPDINKAFRELQMLHKMWKEEIGPVAKEYRDDVWDKFSEATKVIHDKRQAQQEELDKKYEANYEAKKELVAQIATFKDKAKPNHSSWQHAMKKVQELRDTYFATGKVPRNKNKEIWNAFKEATREFNRAKNNFYKEQKKEQYANLEKKRELIKIANENKDSDDFETVTPLMKKIQADWKNIGHVPRKDSDKVWKEFKAACNYYFDRIHAKKNEASQEEEDNLVKKEALLEAIKNTELTGDHKADLNKIKASIKEWKAIGRVPYKKKSIEQSFNKVLDGLFKKLDLGKSEAELIKYENKVSSMVSQEDERKLQNEHFFISKKIDEVKAEINQLENNLGFFQHVPDDNPMVAEVH